jgi:RNA recognition motif-containing protein
MSQGQGLQDAEVVTLHVGNLPFAATPEQLRELFAAHTAVVSIDIPNDPQTGQSRGFAFVSVPGPAAAAAAEALDGQSLLGRRLRVSAAQEHRRQARGPFRH